MDKPKRILFVCTANVDRSRTAQEFFSEQFAHLHFTSAGTDQAATEKAGSQFIQQSLIDQADLILVMENKHRQWIEAHLRVDPEKIQVLDIPDDYLYYSIELIGLLQQKCAALF